MFESIDQSIEAWDRLILELHRVWNRTNQHVGDPPINGFGLIVAQDRRYRQQLQLVLTRCGMSIMTAASCSAASQRRNWRLIIVDESAVSPETVRWLSSSNQPQGPLRVLLTSNRQTASQVVDAGAVDWTYLMPFPAELLATRLVRHLC